MSERPQPPPEARVIAAAQKRAGLSARQAAKRAEMSEGRWRQIVSGYMSVSSGLYVPVKGPADTVARMAAVVGATPEELEAAHRLDVADIMRREQESADAGPDSVDIDTYVGQTPVEKVLLEFLRSNRSAREALEAELNRQLEALNAKVDRLSPPKPQQEPGQDDERQLGA